MTPTTTEKIDERLTPLLLQLPTLPCPTTNLRNDCMQVSDASATAFSLPQGALCGANARKLTTVMVERRTRFFIVETSDRLLRGCSVALLVRNCMSSARINLSLPRFIFGLIFHFIRLPSIALQGARSFGARLFHSCLLLNKQSAHPQPTHFFHFTKC